MWTFSNKPFSQWNKSKQEQGLCKTGIALLYTALLQHDMKFVVGDAMIYCSVLRVGYVRTECDWRKTMLARVMNELSYNLCHIWNDWLQDTPLHPADIPQGSSFIQGFIASGMSAFRCEKEMQLIFLFHGHFCSPILIGVVLEHVIIGLQSPDSYKDVILPV